MSRTDRSPRIKGMHSTTSHDISPLMSSLVATQAVQAKNLMFMIKGKKKEKEGKNKQDQQKAGEGQEEKPKPKEGANDESKDGGSSESGPPPDATTAKTDSAANSSEKKIALKKSSFSFFLGGGSKSGAETSGSAASSSGSPGGASGSNVQFNLPGSTLMALNPFASKKDDDSDSNGGNGSGKSHRLAQAKNMAKGVGYSSYQQKGWDVKAYMAAQKEKDKQIELVLEKIYQELKKLHGSHHTSQRNLPDVITGRKFAIFVKLSTIQMLNITLSCRWGCCGRKCHK